MGLGNTSLVDLVHMDYSSLVGADKEQERLDRDAGVGGVPWSDRRHAGERRYYCWMEVD
jgi:hypothetical protein